MSTSTQPSFPVKQKHLCLNLKGHKTDLIISSYDDHYLVIATQLGTMGTILHARFGIS
uniref:Proteasome assembly chaperone 3 n=1 Tax=Kalanchoe fedtschenkoi TaxID=63787 RepID=A0A7N0VGH1_KALFE